MHATNWVNWPGTKHPTCSCGLTNTPVNVVVVDVHYNAALANVTGGRQGEATTSNAHLLVADYSLIVRFVSFLELFPLHAVVVNFVDNREPGVTVQPCTCILGLLLNYLFTTSRGAAYECLCLFAPRLSPFPLSRALGAGDPCCWGEGEGVRQHIHLLCMLQKVNIPSLSHPFVLTSFVLAIFIQIRELFFEFLPALPISFHPLSCCFQFICKLNCLPFFPPNISKLAPFP
jgi:hypothetical protein